MSTQVWQRPFGAVPLPEGGVEFRVWAPNASTVAVRARGADQELEQAGAGVHAGVIDAAPGDDYVFVLDGVQALPDPCSRHQPKGIRGPSRVVDTSRFEIEPGPALSPEELVLYELHVGTFTREGTFDAVIPRLATPRTAKGSGSSSTSSTTTSAPAATPSARSGPTSPTRTRRSGAPRSTTRSARCANGRSGTPSCGRTTTRSTACGSTPCTRSTTTRPCTSCASC